MAGRQAPRRSTIYDIAAAVDASPATVILIGAAFALVEGDGARGNGEAALVTLPPVLCAGTGCRASAPDAARDGPTKTIVEPKAQPSSAGDGAGRG